MNLERMRFVLDVLQNLPEEREFDLFEWGVHDVGHSPSANNYCGTRACAIGWVMLDPRAPSYGIEPHWRYDGRLIPMIDGVAYPRRDGMEVVAKWLGIGFDHAMWLFAFNSYESEERTGTSGRDAVIKRVEQVIGKQS